MVKKKQKGKRKYVYKMKIKKKNEKMTREKKVGWMEKKIKFYRLLV